MIPWSDLYRDAKNAFRHWSLKLQWVVWFTLASFVALSGGKMTTTQITRGKAIQLKERFKTEILSGEYKPGQRFLSQRQISSKFGVAMMTANRVLGLLEEDRLVARSQGIGTFVTERKRLHTVAFLYNSKIPREYPTLLRLMGGIQQTLEESGSRLQLVGFSADDVTPAQAREVLNDIKNKVIDGLLIMTRLSKKLVVRLEGVGVPAVFVLSRHLEAGLKWPMVGANGYKSNHDRVKHLVRRGYRRIAILNGHVSGTRISKVSSARDGYKQGLIDFGISDYELEIQCEWSSDDAYRHVIEAYPTHKPDAIICGDDILAIGALKAKQELGLNTRSFGIIGAGELMPMALGDEITTTNTHMDRIGRMASSKLIDFIEGHSDGKLDELVDCELILGRSSYPDLP